MVPLDRQGRANTPLATVDQPLLVGTAAGEQQAIELVEIYRRRERHPVVAAEVADLALHTALLVTGRGRAELRCEPPMRAEGNEPHRLLAPPTPQDLAHGTGQVVVAQGPEDAAKVGEGVLVRLEERLLCGTRIGPVERRPARHAAHAEHLQLDPIAGEIGHSLVPVDLSLRAPGVGLWHEGRASLRAEQPPPLADMVADRRATPFTVPMPNSYSRRSCSNNSTFALLSTPPLAPAPQVEGRVLTPGGVGQHSPAQGGRYSVAKPARHPLGELRDGVGELVIRAWS